MLSIDWYLDKSMMNWNVHKRKLPFSNWGNIPTFAWRQWITWLKFSWFLSATPGILSNSWFTGSVTLCSVNYRSSCVSSLHWKQRSLCEQEEQALNISKSLHHVTASVVYCSQFLATDPEVLGWIPGATLFSEEYLVWNGVHSASCG
jgi:hypothetical protein